MVCWWVTLRVITAQSLHQVTVVAGPPVEVQVKVLDWLLTVRLVTLGEPAWRYKQKVQMKVLNYSYWGATQVGKLIIETRVRNKTNQC